MTLFRWVFAACALLAGFCLAGFSAGFARAAEAVDGLDSGPRLTGMRGLNIIPDARMDPPGTVRVGLATSDPYLHVSVSAQIAGPLSLNLRQSARMSGLLETPRTLSPALDVKLRLLEESTWRPALAIGLDSAFGARETASEYIVASKRYGDFDFTAGLGWGRLGAAGHIANPFGFAAQARAVDGDSPNGPGDWFTGKDAAFFAGVAYVPEFAPNLTFKLDWNGDTYTPEKAADPGFHPPSPWSASVNWRAWSGFDLGIGTAGAEKVMARLSWSATPETWGVAPYKATAPPRIPPRSGRLNRSAMMSAAARDGLYLRDVRADPKGQTISAVTESSPFVPIPLQIGRAARYMAAYGGLKPESFVLTPENEDLRGMSVRLSRRDLENAVAGRGSPEEMWQNAEVTAPVAFPSAYGLSGSSKKEHKDPRLFGRFRWILATDLGIQERDAGLVHRTALLADFRAARFRGMFAIGGRVRLNMFGNAADLSTRTDSENMISRGTFGAFSGLRVMPESFYLNASHSFFGGSLHGSLTTGYIEEMFAGTGGEVLWRPFGKRFALGGELWEASRRDPSTPGAVGIADSPVWSGHLNGWLEWPEDHLTFYAKAGRYLGGDWGGTVGLVRDFSNGAKIDASVTLTDGLDRDEFGRRSPAGQAMLSLSLPFGSVPTRLIPQGSEFHLNVRPVGRNAGQFIENPAPLYDRTNGFSTGRLAKGWGRVVE
ncbi:MAG: YjbH domain-containing protein [Rhodospirillales bacterium]|nr:YjbH domain-containing protein [Rhodospirillales bacterium]